MAKQTTKKELVHPNTSEGGALKNPFTPSLLHRERGMDVPFTGVARSVECYNYEGNSNFRIVRLYIENNVIVKREYSDPYALFEVIAICELEMEKCCHSLSGKWQSGKALFK